VEEGASFAEFAFTGFDPVLAGDCFIIRVNGTESSFTEIFWKWLYVNIIDK